MCIIEKKSINNNTSDIHYIDTKIKVHIQQKIWNSIVKEDLFT